MKNNKKKNINYWDLDSSLNFFKNNRKKIDDLYIGEKLILSKILKNNITILDYGCASGGFLNILKSLLKNFKYIGVDSSHKMIEIAKKKYPEYNFFTTSEFEKKLTNKKFDLVIILGLLHLNKNWRNILKNNLKFVKKYILFDLRETDSFGIEDIKKSYFMMNFNEKNPKFRNFKIPYNIINSKKIEKFLNKNFKNFYKYIEARYYGKPSLQAKTKFKKIIFGNYCFKKND